MMWHLLALSLWNRIRGRDTHFWVSLDTHTLDLFQMYTHSMETAKPGWDLVSWDMGSFIRSSLIFKVRLSECDWYIYVSHIVFQFLVYAYIL